MTETLLAVEELTAGYPPLVVLRDVSLEILTGQVHAVVGANGAGKTTLMRAISGFGPPIRGSVSGGEVRFSGERITNMAPALITRRGVRLVPEASSSFMPLTVGENIRLAVNAGRRAGASGDLSNLMFDTFPVLAERRQQKAGLLSGGERQMLGISMGIISSPKLLMIDEASIGLSPVAIKTIYRALQTLCHELDLTILFVEQNIEAVMMLADHVHVMRQGSIVFESNDVSGLHTDELYQLMTAG